LASITATPAYIAGVWTDLDGNTYQVIETQTGSDLVFYANGSLVPDTEYAFVSADQISGPATGTVNGTANTIHWSNGNVWSLQTAY
jgi:hypothetical protein